MSVEGDCVYIKLDGRVGELAWLPARRPVQNSINLLFPCLYSFFPRSLQSDFKEERHHFPHLFNFFCIYVNSGKRKTVWPLIIYFFCFFYLRFLLGTEYQIVVRFSSHATEMTGLRDQTIPCGKDFDQNKFLPNSALNTTILLEDVAESLHYVVMNHPGDSSCQCDGGGARATAMNGYF